MSIHQRLEQLIKKEHGGSKNKFCQNLDIQPGSFYAMFKKETNPSFDTLNKILDYHPKISVKWLIRGEGEMIEEKTDNSKKELENALNELSAVKKEIVYLKEINELLRSKK